MNYTIKKEINPKDFLELRSYFGWKDIPLNQVTKAIKNSMVNISIYDNDICVGIGRVVGDNAFKGMLTDIMINPSYQKQGLGKLIVENLINKIKDNIEEGELFMLEASPTANNRDFYIKCGLKYKPEVQDGVYLWIKK